MRIVYVAYGVLSPTRAHNLQTVRTVDALAARGHDVTFINPCLPADRAAAERHLPRCATVLLPAGGIFELHRRHAAGGRFWSLFADRSAYALRALRHVRAARADVVVTRDLVVCAWLLAARPVTRTPVGYELHTLEQVMFDAEAAVAGGDDALARRVRSVTATDFAGHQDDDSRLGELYKRFIRRLENRTLRRVPVVLTLTAAVGRRLERELGIARPRTVPSGHAVTPALGVDKAARRRALGLPEDRRIAIYSGLSFHGKGLESLFAVAPHLPPDCLVVVLGGERDTSAALAALSDQLGLGARIRFVPGVTPRDVPAYLEAADLGLLLYPPTRYLAEFSSPLKLMEYLGHGLPVVATRLPSLEEVVQDGVNGRLVEPGDPAAAAAAIAATAGDSALLERLAAGARASAREYAFPRRAERIEEAVRCIST